MVTNGQRRNKAIINTSKIKRQKNIIKSARITNVLINIPIPIEKPTSPSRYSFFHGRKYVFMSKRSENALKKALFKDLKKERRPIGASKNQNLKKRIGNCRKKNMPIQLLV